MWSYLKYFIFLYSPHTFMCIRNLLFNQKVVHEFDFFLKHDIIYVKSPMNKMNGWIRWWTWLISHILNEHKKFKWIWISTCQVLIQCECRKFKNLYEINCFANIAFDINTNYELFEYADLHLPSTLPYASLSILSITR